MVGKLMFPKDKALRGKFVIGRRESQSLASPHTAWTGKGWIGGGVVAEEKAAKKFDDRRAATTELKRLLRKMGEDLDEAKYTDVTGNDPVRALLDAGVKSIRGTPGWKKADVASRRRVVSKIRTALKSKKHADGKVWTLDLTKSGGGKFRIVVPADAPTDYKYSP
jgi:hypothetical protein